MEQLPKSFRSKMGHLINVQIRRRTKFTYEDVVSDWGVNGAGLPHFSARLFNEVTLLKRAIGRYIAKRSLEIGCGYGRLTPWIAKHSNEHYAIEPELALLNDAKKLYPNVHFYRTKAQKLPFPNHYFDLCVSWTVIQHIPPNQLIKAISEIKRTCTPKAIIVLAEGVGQFSMTGYWEHTLEEWTNLFSPWKLTWCTERKLEETFKGNSGLVMRFERENG